MLKALLEACQTPRKLFKKKRSPPSSIFVTDGNRKVIQSNSAANLGGNDRVHLHLFSDHSAHARIHRLVSKQRQPPTFCDEVAERLSSFLVAVLAYQHTHDLSPTKHRARCRANLEAPSCGDATKRFHGTGFESLGRISCSGVTLR